MNEAENAPRSEEEIIHLELRPVTGDKEARWIIQLDGDLFSLMKPDGQLAIMLPRDEAARHIRFERDFLMRSTVSIVVTQGLRALQFRCSGGSMKPLLAWLPQKPEAQREQEVRYYGAALVLAGMVQLLFPDQFQVEWGVAFILLGLLPTLIPSERLYIANACAMAALGLYTLFYYTLMPAESVEGISRIISTAFGSILLIWAIQQSALSSPSHRLHTSRTHRVAEQENRRAAQSPAVRKVGWAMLALAVILTGLLAGGWIQQAPGVVGPSRSAWVLCIGLWVLSVGIALVLRIPKTVTYVEARMGGQFLVATVVFYLSGTVAEGVLLSDLWSPAVLWAGLAALAAKPLLWLVLIIFVALFNRWFNRAVRREFLEAEE